MLETTKAPKFHTSVLEGLTPKMTPAFPHPNNEANDKHPELDPEYLSYEWSKGYLPTENPKPDEVDLPEERNK